MNPFVLGLVRGLGAVILAAVLTYLGDASHLTGVVTPYVATIIAALALALEGHIEGKTGAALFGAVRVQK
jgi:hypothetical protein